MNQSLQNYIENLSLGIKFFEDPKNKGKFFVTVSKKEYSEDDIRALSFFVLQDLLDDYKLYTEEDLAIITLERFELDLGRLRTQIGNAETNVPVNIAEMVTNMERDKAKVAAALAKRHGELHKYSIALKTAVARQGDSDYPNPEEAEILIEVAKTDKERLTKAIEAKVKNKEAAETYVAYAATVEPGQIVARIDPKTATPHIGREIENAAKLAALGVAYAATENTDYLKKESQKPEFRDNLRTEIKNNNPDAKEEQINKTIDEYITALSNSKPTEPRPAINSNDLTVVYLPPVSKSASVAKNSFGDKTNIFNLALANTLATAPLPVIPVVETGNEQIAAGTADVIARFYGEAGTEILTPNIVMSEALALESASLPAYGGFLLPLAAAFSGKEVAKTDPAKAVANHMFFTQQMDAETLHNITRGLNLNFQEVAQVEDHLNTLARAFPTYLKNADINQITSIVAAKINLSRFEANREPIMIATFPASGQTSFDGYMQQVTATTPLGGLQNLFVNVGQNVFGRIGDNFLERAIRTNLAEKVAGKVATSAIGNTVTSLAAKAGLALTALGEFVSNAIPVVGPIITFIASKIVGWLAKQFVQKIVPWLRENAGYILGVIGVGGALALGFGGVGAVVAGLGGLALGGAISGTGAAAAVFVFLGALLSFLVAALIVPLLIALIGIPIVTAFILFIINAGAYVVPPAGTVNLNNTPSSPHNCFVLDSSWHEPYTTTINNAISVVSKAGNYMDKLCAKGNVTLSLYSVLTSTIYTNPDGSPVTLNALTPGNPTRAIYISVAGLNQGQWLADYLLAHESGHVLSEVSNWLQVFADTPSTESEVPDCTYFQLSHNIGEDFAEMIGRYISEPLRQPRVAVWGCSTVNKRIITVTPSVTWKTAYPQTWQFAHDKLFEENLGW